VTGTGCGRPDCERVPEAGGDDTGEPVGTRPDDSSEDAEARPPRRPASSGRDGGFLGDLIDRERELAPESRRATAVRVSGHHPCARDRPEAEERAGHDGKHARTLARRSPARPCSQDGRPARRCEGRRWPALNRHRRARKIETRSSHNRASSEHRKRTISRPRCEEARSRMRPSPENICVLKRAPSSSPLEGSAGTSVANGLHYGRY